MNGNYKRLSVRQANKEISDFPPLDVARCEEQANSLFKPYLFFKRGKEDIELQCSRCRRAGRMDYLPRTITMAEQCILDGHHNDKALCPWCGKEVTLKEMRYLGRRVSLCEYHLVVFLDERDGAIFAQCFWTMKDYRRELTDPPLFMQTKAIRFEIGRVTEWVAYEGGVSKRVVEGRYGRSSCITEPFTNDAWHPMGLSYLPYTVFGREAIGRSEAYRYCQYHRMKTVYEKDSVMMRYLAIYSIYPRLTEMLMKSGMAELVKDLIYEKKKNARVLCWEAPDTRSAFSLDGQEMRAFRDAKVSPYVIGDYKALKRAGIRTEFSRLKEIGIYGHSIFYHELIQVAVSDRIRPERIHRYLLKHEKECNGRGNAWYAWRDYHRMAKELGYDLDEASVLFPKDLKRRHDEATAEINLRKERTKREQEKAALARAKKNMAARRKKYNFTMGGYFIRIAETREEIRREGRTLQHCVGGYAERHIANKTTILFLRREATPEASLYTVEMDGDQLRQIHGYRNSWPQKDMEWFLTPWLAWLQAGSPRDKQGEPIIPETKEAKTA